MQKLEDGYTEVVKWIQRDLGREPTEPSVCKALYCIEHVKKQDK